MTHKRLKNKTDPSHHRALRLRMSGAIPLLPVCASYDTLSGDFRLQLTHVAFTVINAKFISCNVIIIYVL